MWDSTGPKGGPGAKIQRALVSEIVGLGVQTRVKTSSRIDPVRLMAEAGPAYRSASPSGIGWTAPNSSRRPDAAIFTPSTGGGQVHYLSNRIFDDNQHLLDAGAWQQLTPDTLRSVCACDYITSELER